MHHFLLNSTSEYRIKKYIYVYLYRVFLYILFIQTEKKTLSYWNPRGGTIIKQPMSNHYKYFLLVQLVMSAAQKSHTLD